LAKVRIQLTFLCSSTPRLLLLLRDARSMPPAAFKPSDKAHLRVGDGERELKDREEGDKTGFANCRERLFSCFTR